MRYIDLLPKKEKAINKKTIALNIIIVFLIILLVVLVMSIFFLNSINKNLSARLEEYEVVNMRFQDKIKKLEVFEEFKNKVENKRKMAGGLDDILISWSEIIFTIGKSTPEGIFLENFDGNIAGIQNYIASIESGEEAETNKINSFNIRGYAKNYNDVSTMVVNIKNLPLIEDAWVENINKTVIAENVDAISFFISSYWQLDPFLEGIDVKTPEKQETEEINIENSLE